MNDMPAQGVVAVATKTIDRLYSRASVEQDYDKLAKTAGTFAFAKILYHPAAPE
jgi:hypothetical protein